MAKFVIETTPEEQEAVLNVLKGVEGQVIAVSALADLAGLTASRVRYTIIDLLDARKIARIPAKAMNKHYVRYTYKIL